ncbi:lytic transglycosylase domain-containing protein [Lysobacter tyrosinilyticus]
MELMSCPNLAVPNDVMQHVVHVESAFNPFAIGVVGGRLVRQPRNLAEAVSTVRMLDARGFNFSVGLAQVNKHNFDRYGLDSYERAFQACPNLQAGSRILAECYGRSGGNWGKSFSCYYSGNFTTGFRHGYVQKVYASMRGNTEGAVAPIAVVPYIARKRSAAPLARPAVVGTTWQQRLDATAMRQPATAPAAVSQPMAENVPQGGPVVLQPTSAGLAPQAPTTTTQSLPAEPGDKAFVF